MGSSLEPFTRQQLFDWLSTQGAVVDRQRGAHMWMRFPNGREVPCPDPKTKHKDVPTILAKGIAHVLGMDLGLLRQALGYQVTPSVGRGVVKGQRRPVSDSHRQMLLDLQRAAGCVAEHGVLPTQRDFMQRQLPGILRVMERIASSQ